MQLRQLILAFALAVVAPATLLAATEFENGVVPAELARLFAGGGIYRSLPDNFPLVPLPAGIDASLVGSVDRGGTKELVLRTRNANALRESLIAAYVAAGWSWIGQSLATGQSATIGQLCHDTAGYLVFNKLASGHLLATLYPAHGPGLTCAQQAAENGGWDSYFVQLMPALDAPPQTLTQALYRFPYMTASYSYNATGSQVVIDKSGQMDIAELDAAGVYAHFAAQLVEQGWSNDVEDASARSAASVWYASVPAPDFAASDVRATELTGILTVLNLGSQRFRVSFQLRAVTNAVVTTGSFSVVRDLLPLGPPQSAPTLGIRGLPSGYGGR